MKLKQNLCLFSFVCSAEIILNLVEDNSIWSEKQESLLESMYSIFQLCTYQWFSSMASFRSQQKFMPLTPHK